MAIVFAVVAAAIHVFIFVMESVLWRRPRTWHRFGLRTQADADTVRPMAFNQGFYNLFLAAAAIAGAVLLALGLTAAGVTAIAIALGSMLLASLVLLASQPKLWRAAITQGAAPLVGLVLLVAGAAI